MKQGVNSIADEKLRAAILAEFAAEKNIAAANVRVGVLNGIAHLAGLVDSLTDRSAVEELARRVPGVRGIVNRIEAPGAPSPSRTINLDLSQNKKENLE